MSRVDLDALEKLHAQSSPGDWKAIDREDSTTFVMRGDPRSDHWAFDVCADGRDIEVLLLEFYNAAHNSLPVLIAELREARELLACATNFRTKDWEISKGRNHEGAERWLFAPYRTSTVECRTLAEAIAAMRAAVEKARKAC